MNRQACNIATAESLYDDRATRKRFLDHWISGKTVPKISRSAVCRHHAAPWDYFREIFLDRPALALVHGPRGGGKSFLSALDTHLNSRWTSRHYTRILGGSKGQSEQVYYALREVLDLEGPHADGHRAIQKLLSDRALYKNGSEVKILAASSTSVRGPHVPSLKLDEVDEIDTDLREAAMGMCMNRADGLRTSVIMTLTWHRLGGPMADLIDRATNGEFPLYTFCVFEVLEHCPDSRSGTNLEKCPECPLMPWCHADRDEDERGRPKAKRSKGHYSIESLIQKVRATSMRTFESDYLCKGPRADGLWFAGFNLDKHVAERAEYDPSLPVRLSIDSGVFTGAVFFQIARRFEAQGVVEEIRIFADYLAEGLTAEQNGYELLELSRKVCRGRLDHTSTDPAGGSRNPVGPTVIAEFERAGLRPLHRWPIGSIADGMALLESFVQPADGGARLLIHPRCQAIARGLENYRRAKRGGQWQDYPEDPQHPHEDLVNALRGGLRSAYPEGRVPQSPLRLVNGRKVF